ncbi:hypothetical protein M1271_00905 [Patescibacteria group bacterium]|nr:hypothetical protein [Patescibacteria group bacterium]
MYICGWEEFGTLPYKDQAEILRVINQQESISVYGGMNEFFELVERLIPQHLEWVETYCSNAQTFNKIKRRYDLEEIEAMLEGLIPPANPALMPPPKPKPMPVYTPVVKKRVHKTSKPSRHRIHRLRKSKNRKKKSWIGRIVGKGKKFLSSFF